MARNVFWLAIISGALAAIVAGFAQGSYVTHPPPLAQLRKDAQSSNVAAAVSAAGNGQPRDAAIEDPFTQDDVVVDRPRAVQREWQRESLAIVIAVCGQSIAIESGFLRVGFPLGFVVDPNAPQAVAFSRLVRAAGDTLFVQSDAPPTAAFLGRVRRQLGSFDGVASRRPNGMAAALQGTGLAFFDERGAPGNAAEFAAKRVPLISRDVTADDRGSQGYVTFMLERAAALSRRGGPIVVLMRPLPSSLTALRGFTAAHDVTMAALQ